MLSIIGIFNFELEQAVNISKRKRSLKIGFLDSKRKNISITKKLVDFRFLKRHSDLQYYLFLQLVIYHMIMVSEVLKIFNNKISQNFI